MPAGAQAAAADEAATQDHDSLLSPEGIAMDTAPDTQEQLFAVRRLVESPVYCNQPRQQAHNAGSHSLRKRNQHFSDRTCWLSRCCHASARQPMQPHVPYMQLIQMSVCADDQSVTTPSGGPHCRAASYVSGSRHLRQAHSQHCPQHLGDGRRQARHSLPTLRRHLQGTLHAPSYNALDTC